MKRMDNSGKYGGDGKYRITDCGNYYIVVIASDKANAMRTYEYDAGCGSIEEVEKELEEEDIDFFYGNFVDEYLDTGSLVSGEEDGFYKLKSRLS